jgi:hypothetical protein
MRHAFGAIAREYWQSKGEPVARKLQDSYDKQWVNALPKDLALEEAKKIYEPILKELFDDKLIKLLFSVNEAKNLGQEIQTLVQTMTNLHLGGKLCKKCGRFNRPDAIYCDWCGTPFEDIKPQPEPAPDPKGH